MAEKTITIKNRAGIHARPASIIVKKANEFVSEIYFEKEKMRINGKSIIGIISLCAGYNTTLKIITEGADEEKALDAIVQLFENRFEET